MAISYAQEHEALSYASANAELEKALALLKTDKESLRAGHWNRLDEQVRKMICHMAGVGVKKGEGALQDMDALERGKVNRVAARLIRDLEVVIRCAQGGAMPAAWGSVQ
jgi:hypothetical protein